MYCVTVDISAVHNLQNMHCALAKTLRRTDIESRVGF